MGRRIIYKQFPRRPRIARLAWVHFHKEHGTPSELYFNDTDGHWVGIYPQLEVQVTRETIEGTGGGGRGGCLRRLET